MWTAYQLFVSVLMVVTGSINTITIKWSNRSKSVGRDGVEKNFHHPYFQTGCMFVGEIMNLVVFKVMLCVLSKRGDGSEDEYKLTKGNRDFNPFLLYIPTICDMTATSIMYIGLNMTYASSYQMLKGGVIVFIGIFSMIFLKRTVGLRKWSGIAIIILGLVIVGLADYLSKRPREEIHSSTEIIIGDVLIAFAQIISAAQFVIEEKYVQGENIPTLAAIGWEGVFGFLTLGLLQIPMYLIKADRPLTRRKGERVEDIIDAFVQIGNNWELCMLVPCNIIAVALSHYAGLAITKELSATTRKVLDSVRILVVWSFSLAFFDQFFHWMQLLGFCLLVFGMCLYNKIGAATFATCTKTCRGEGSNSNTETAIPQ